MSSIPDSGAGCRPHAPEPTPARFGPTHQLILLLAVFGLGTVLFAAGTPIGTVFALLTGCGGIGAGTLAAADGRRPVQVRVEAAVHAAAGK